MKMKNPFFRIFICCLLSSTLSAQESTQYLRLSLPEALKIAGELQPDLRNAERNIAYAEAVTKGARSGYLPKLILETDLRYNPIIPTSVLPGNALNPNGNPKDIIPIRFGTPWDNTVGLRLTQPIYDPVKLATVKGNKMAEELAVAQEKRLKSDRFEEIAKAWYALLLAKSTLTYCQKDVNRNKENEVLINEQVQQGKSLENDLRDARLRIRSAEIEKDKSEQDIFSARVYLSYMIGYDSLVLIDPIESLEGFTKQESESKINPLDKIKSAEEARPEIIEEKINLQISELELSRIKADRLPVLNFEGFLGANHFSYKFSPFTSWFGNSFLGLSLRWPIYSGDEKKQAVEQSKIQVEQQKNTLRKARQQVYYDLVNTQNDVSYQQKLYAVQLEKIQIQEERVTLIRARLQEGRATSQELLDGETSLAKEQDSLFRIQYDLLIARLAKEKASGLLVLPQ
jgi:outer membrane protein TolC